MTEHRATPSTPRRPSAAWQAWWQSRPVRERRLLGLGLVVVGAWALWTWVWFPSWQTLRDAPARRSQQLVALQSVQQLAAQAEYWRAQPEITRATRDANLQSLAQASGLRLQAQANGWRVEIVDWSAERLSEWLLQVQQQAHADIRQSVLTQQAGRWSGWMSLDTEGQP